MITRTWWLLAIQEEVDILHALLYLEVEHQPRKLKNKWWTYKLRTQAISLTSSHTTSWQLYVISHQEVWRCQVHSLVIQLPLENYSTELANNSQLCSEERLSYTGSLVKVWMKQNLLNAKVTWTILLVNTKASNLLQLMMKLLMNKKWHESEIIFI